MHILFTLNLPKNVQVLLYKPVRKRHKHEAKKTFLKIKGNITDTFLILPEPIKIGQAFSESPADSKTLYKNIKIFFSCGKRKDILTSYKIQPDTFILYNLFFSTINFLRKELDAVNSLYIKNLQIFGFGYRAYLSKSQTTLGLKLGFSHKIYMKMRKYQKFQKINRYNITLLGPFQDLLAQTSSDIRKFRAPDAYKGKGVRFLGEKFSFKVGKKAQDR